jgi:hypothetical protein
MTEALSVSYVTKRECTVSNVTMEKNEVFRGDAWCGSCENRRFGGTHSLRHESANNQRSRNKAVLLSSVLRLLVTANIVSSSPIIVTLMMEAIRSSETSVLTRVT